MNISKNEYDAIVLSKSEEIDAQKELVQLLKNSPIPGDEILGNLGLFLSSKNLGRILFFSQIYEKILSHHGSIIEFGVRWGQTLGLMSALRGLHEPFNRHRKIVGFDTFTGFAGVTDKDGSKSRSKEGSFGVSEDYEQHLESVLRCIDDLSPLNHLKKYELIKGDAKTTVPQYFGDHPECIVSLAIFDFDIYSPTRVALDAIKERVTKGSILVFDELADDVFPGETIALREVFDLNKLELKRCPFASRVSYVEL